MLEEVLMRNAEPFPSATCASNLVGESELCSRIHFLVHANFHVSERTVSAGGGGGRSVVRAITGRGKSGGAMDMRYKGNSHRQCLSPMKT